MVEVKFNLTKQELRRIFNWEKLVLIALGALAINFLFMPLINIPWEGWDVVISSVGGSIFGEWLD